MQQVEAPALCFQLERMCGGHQPSRRKASWTLQLLMMGISASCFGGRLTLKTGFHRHSCFSLHSVFLSGLTSSHDFNYHFPVLCFFLVCPELQLRFQLFLQLFFSDSYLQLVNCSPPPRWSQTLVFCDNLPPLYPPPCLPHLPSSGRTTRLVLRCPHFCSNHLDVILCYYLSFGVSPLCADSL